MSRLVETRGVHEPDTVAAMTAAFDTVCQSLSARVSGNDDARRQLALISSETLTEENKTRSDFPNFPSAS